MDRPGRGCGRRRAVRRLGRQPQRNPESWGCAPAYTRAPACCPAGGPAGRRGEVPQGRAILPRGRGVLPTDASRRRRNLAQDRQRASPRLRCRQGRPALRRLANRPDRWPRRVRGRTGRGQLRRAEAARPSRSGRLGIAGRWAARDAGRAAAGADGRVVSGRRDAGGNPNRVGQPRRRTTLGESRRQVLRSEPLPQEREVHRVARPHAPRPVGTRPVRVFSTVEEYRVQARLDGKSELAITNLVYLSGYQDHSASILLVAVRAKLPVAGRVSYKLPKVVSASCGYKAVAAVTLVAEVRLARSGETIKLQSPELRELHVELTGLQLSNDLLHVSRDLIEDLINHEISARAKTRSATRPTARWPKRSRPRSSTSGFCNSWGCRRLGRCLGCHMMPLRGRLRSLSGRIAFDSIVSRCDERGEIAALI